VINRPNVENFVKQYRPTIGSILCSPLFFFCFFDTILRIDMFSTIMSKFKSEVMAELLEKAKINVMIYLTILIVELSELKEKVKNYTLKGKK